jgi:hypothetical protein
MKPYHRYGALFSAVALLATAGVLGISRWNQTTPAHERGLKSTSAEDAAVFVERPKAAEVSHTTDDRPATKVSRRPPQPRVTTPTGPEPDQPRPGEPTYRMEDLPKTCGTYWVEDANGGFSRLAVCNPENHPDGSH